MKAIAFAKSMPTFNKTTCIRSSDGVPFIYFRKEAVFSPWGIILGIVGVFLFMAAIRALLSVHPL